MDGMTTSPAVRVDIRDAVATITLDRPEALNSLTTEAKAGLLEALHAVGDDASVRAVVITGAGRGFCVGQDLKEHTDQLAAGEDGPFTSVSVYYNPIAEAIATMPKPVIAAVNGVAAGAGLSIAMLADFRVAAASAKFTTSFAGIALSCDTGASWSLQRLVGYGRARQMLFDPTPIGAETALAWGLVTEVVPDDELAAHVDAWAARLAAGPTLAYAAMREALEYGSSHSLSESLAFEEPRMMTTGRSQDHTSAVEAFLAKRKPTFEGR